MSIIIKHSETIYDINELSKYFEYFEVLESSNFLEKSTGIIDLTHRGDSMKIVLDIFTNFTDINQFEIRIRHLNSEILIEIKLIINELMLYSDYIYLSYDLDKYINIKTNQEKEGKICHECYRINIWLKPDKKLDWDENRNYCYCDYVRKEDGSRQSRRDFLEEYYSNDENCKHGSSTW